MVRARDYLCRECTWKFAKRNKYFMESNTVCRVCRLHVWTEETRNVHFFFCIFHFMFAAATLHIVQFQFESVVCRRRWPRSHSPCILCRCVRRVRRQSWNHLCILNMHALYQCGRQKLIWFSPLLCGGRACVSHTLQLAYNDRRRYARRTAATFVDKSHPKMHVPFNVRLALVCM